ncbi:MAG: ESPR domain-containing protein [Rhodanobacteraceae bacterium]
MNRIFSLVWNRALGALRVASELTRSRGGGAAGAGTSSHGAVRKALALAVVAALVAWMLPSPAFGCGSKRYVVTAPGNGVISLASTGGVQPDLSRGGGGCSPTSPPPPPPPPAGYGAGGSGGIGAAGYNGTTGTWNASGSGTAGAAGGDGTGGTGGACSSAAKAAGIASSVAMRLHATSQRWRLCAGDRMQTDAPEGYASRQHDGFFVDERPDRNP